MVICQPRQRLVTAIGKLGSFGRYERFNPFSGYNAPIIFSKSIKEIVNVQVNFQGVLYYNMINRLSTNLRQLCVFEPWKPSPVLSPCYTSWFKCCRSIHQYPNI